MKAGNVGTKLVSKPCPELLGTSMRQHQEHVGPGQSLYAHESANTEDEKESFGLKTSTLSCNHEEPSRLRLAGQTCGT